MDKLVKEISVADRQNEEVCRFVKAAVKYVNGLVETAQKEDEDCRFVKVSLEDVYSAVYEEESVPAKFTGKTWKELYETEVERVILGCIPVVDSLIAVMLSEMVKELQREGYFMSLYGGVSLDWVNRHGYTKVHWK